MRQIALILSFIALLSQPLAAQTLPYSFDFDAGISAPPDSGTDIYEPDDGQSGDATSSQEFWETTGPEAETIPYYGAVEADDGELAEDRADERQQFQDSDRPETPPRANSDSERSYAPVAYAPARGDVPSSLASVERREDMRSVLPGSTSGQEGGRVAAIPVKSRTSTYGPFRVLDESTAAMVGVTDERTPALFSAMVRDHPGIALLKMVDCPGTEDSNANLRLGLMIRAQGIATHVPKNGWVASGAVEVFLAGTRRTMEPGASFAVHSWEDASGRQPKDYSPNAPENRIFINYYHAMGMSESDAIQFYAMTNSSPFSRPRILSATEMGRWSRLQQVTLAVLQ